MAGNCGQQQHLSVPPGFRFHPTEEELLYYYLRKKVSYEPIDLDVIREVDLNKLEPWDLNDKCGIGSGPQNEWYFFSHKDKKYPTGTRTNRATMAGFWKATGRDKAIHLTNSKRIGMRKTLVFYTGRAPHGHKSDWIMHEYRLDEDNAEIQEDGWVICRAFKKKNHTRINNFHPDIDHEDPIIHSFGDRTLMEPKQNSDDDQATYNNSFHHTNATLLTCPDSKILPFSSSSSLPLMDVQRSQSLLRLSAVGPGIMHVGKFSGDWSFLEKLLATNQNQFPVSHVSDLVAAQERMFSFP